MTLAIVILLALHLMAMNVASAAPLVCIWLHRRGARGDVTAFRVGRRLAWIAVASLLVGAAVGFLLWGLAWIRADRGYLDAVERFPLRDLLHAGGEVVFSLACLTIYAGLWNRWREWPWLHGFWAVVSATNLLYHFPPLMIVLGELAARPELVSDATITRDVFRPLIVRPEILAQSLHFIVASAAVAGVALMAVARLAPDQRDDSTETDSAAALVRAGARLALAASLVQLPMGVWVLVELPVAARNGLTGDNAFATALFFLSIVLTFALLHTLGTVAMGDSSGAVVWRCGVLLVCVMLLMTGVLQSARRETRLAWSDTPDVRSGGDREGGQRSPPVVDRRPLAA